MKITSLGHSAFVLEMETRDGADMVRILVDPWVSDFVVGDLLGRFPRIRFDPKDLGRLDAIYLTHSHTDHLDPESLVGIWRGLGNLPTLLLPQSLAHLAGLLGENLPGASMLFLEEGREIDFRGITLMGFFNPEPLASNEDDVMVLLAGNGREVFLNESDAVLPLTDPDFRDELAALLLPPEAEVACFLTTKNELGPTMAMIAAKDRADREERLTRVLSSLDEDIQAIYDGAEEDPLFGDARLVRLVGGQGIAAPEEILPGLNRALFPVRRADRVRLERTIARNFGAALGIDELVPEEVHQIGPGAALERQPCGYLELLDAEESRHFDPESPHFDPFPLAPLRDDDRDPEPIKRAIQTALNERFLPWILAHRDPPFETVLAEWGGGYRIRVRFGDGGEVYDRDFRAGFDSLRFEEVEPRGDAAEHYFANDLHDFLEGRCDEFSRFCRRPLPAPAQRFWSALGMPFLNQDLVKRKLGFHFERIRAGESNRDFVLPLLGSPE